MAPLGHKGGPTTRSDDAHKAAAKAADPSIQCRTVSTGDSNNVLLAKQATATMVSQGADVLFLMLDNGFAGAQQAVPGVRQGRRPG